MQRISVVGTSGSGKSTLARAISERLGIEYIELDAIYHNGAWASLTRDEFRNVITERCAGDAWVVCGNYNDTVLDLVWARADTVIVLQPPKPVVMWRVTTRTLGRLITRKPLWGGLKESWSDQLQFWNPEKSVIGWAWSTYDENTARYAAAAADPANAHLTFTFLTSPLDSEVFVNNLRAPDANEPAGAAGSSEDLERLDQLKD